MDPYLEQRLRDEVIYLHSLWHQGPPASSSNPNPRFNPNPYPTNTNRPSSNPNYSKNRKRIRKAINERERPSKKKPSHPDPSPHLGPPWPCPSLFHDSAPGTFTPWPTKPNSAPVAHPQSLKEQPRLAAMTLQHNALDSCRGMFLAGSDSEDSEPEEEEEEEESGESEEYKVLLNVFVERSELRSYYEVNYENGEFYCLVCGGLGKKKRVKGCIGLVQHSISISNTKRRRAHRAFAKVVCRVLGWDFDRLPTIVLKGERLGLSLEKLVQQRGEPHGNSGSCEGVSVVVEDNVAAESAVEVNVVAENFVEDDAVAENALEVNVAAENAIADNVAAESDVNSELGERETFDDHQNKGKELMICEISLKNDSTNKTTESIDKGISEMEANNKAVDTWGTDQSLTSKTEWPCEESNVSSSTVLGWPTLSSPAATATCSVPVEEEARSVTLLLQKKALKECQEFFAGKNDSYSDEDNSEDEDKGNFMDEDGSEESEELKFFTKIFTEDGELRSFYEKNYEGGEFYCLVCGGIGKKVWKRFKGCVALLQHSTAILKTKKKVAHRAYGQVICKVLGWDIGRPPTTGSKDKPLGDGPSEKSAVSQSEPKENADDHRDNVVVSKENLEYMSGHSGEIVSKEELDAVQSDGISKTCELPGELEEHGDDQKDDVAVSKEDVNSMSGHSGEIVLKEESDVVQRNGVSKTSELQGELEAYADDHKDNVVFSKESLDSLSGLNGEIVSKEEPDAFQSNQTSKTYELRGEVEENADNYKDNVIVSKENLDAMSGHNGVRVSEEVSDVVWGNGTSKPCELQVETGKNVDDHNEDLNVFLENLDPL